MSILEAARRLAEKEEKERAVKEANKPQNTQGGTSSNATQTNNSTTGRYHSARVSEILSAAARLNEQRKKAAQEKTVTKNNTSTNTSKKYTDYNAESKNVYTSTKDKLNTKTTIASNLTEKQRKDRIKEIDQELSTLNTKLSGYSRAKVYGTNKALLDAEEKDKERLAQLTKEKKELERVGTFSASELKQFEIDDAKAKVASANAKVNSYGARPTANTAESYKQAVSEQYKAQEELKGLERQNEMYDDITKFGDVVNKDTFGGQWKANYRSNELSREADKAMNRYLDNPTEENRQIAYVYDVLARTYAENNEKALDDENVKASWLTKSAAGYLPQFTDQILPELVGGGVGGILGSAVGAPSVGMSLGAGLATGAQSYGVMRGSVYRTLLAEGVDEETALQAANDEALISSLIEGGETALSWLLAGGTKAVKAITGAAKSSVAKGSTNVATKFIANLATNKAASKAAAEASKPLWKKGLGIAFDVAKNGASEYIEEYTQGAVSRANRERALSGTPMGGKGQLVKDASEVIENAITGKDLEARAELHEQGWEGAKIGLMFGGTNATVNNIVYHYVNAKTVKEQNEVVDAIIKDDEDLKLIIEEGKASGKGTVSAKIAEEVEKANEKGEVTREQVKKLIASTSVYAEAEKQASSNPLEQAAREVVEGRNRTGSLAMLEARKAGNVDAQMLETLSQHNVPITTAEAKTVTGFGEKGAEIVAKLSNIEGATFNEAVAEVRPSYIAGFNHPDLDIKQVAHTFNNSAQADAYTAGQIDGKFQNIEASAKAKNARVFGDESGVVRDGNAKGYTSEQLKMADTIGKDLGSQVSFEERLLANTETEAEANAWHQDGEIKRSNTSDEKFIADIMEESLHRMAEINTKEVQVLLRETYDFVVERDRSRGIAVDLAFAEEKALHDNAGVTLNTRGYMEEVSVGELSTMLFRDEKAWNRWRERLDANPELRTAWQKLCDYVSEIIEKLRRLLAEGSFSKATREKVNKDLADLERFRGLYGEAYKATRDAVAERTKAVQNAETTTESKSEAVASENTSSNKETHTEAKSEQRGNRARNTSSKMTDKTKNVLGKDVSKRVVGVKGGRAYISNGKITIPIEKFDVAFVKSEWGLNDSDKVGNSVEEILNNEFVPISTNPVEGKMSTLALYVFTTVDGREIAIQKRYAQYLDGYNLSATFAKGRPYAIKATDADGNLAGVVMAVQPIGRKTYELTDTKDVSMQSFKNKPVASENKASNIETSPSAKSKPQTKTTSIKQGDVFVADKAGIEYKILLRDDTNTIVEISSAEGTETMMISNEIADEKLTNIPPEGITKWVDDDAHIDNRTWEDVGNRKVKAFQFLFPEMQEYYAPLARELLNDLDNTIKGERFATDEYAREWVGVSRFTSEAIATIKDSTNASYDDIRNALERLINDEGQENTALAKRIELVLDDMLTDGYTTFEGEKIPANEEYNAKKEALIGKTYESKNAEGDLDWLADINFSLKNKNLSKDSRIPFTVLENYIDVVKKDVTSLNNLEKEVKNLERKIYQNNATGYRAKITSDTIGKAIKPTNDKKFSPFTVEHIRNLNAIRKLPELFKKAVYVDSMKPQKGKSQNPSYKEFHHFVAPIFMDNGEYRAIITAREKVNSNTLYVLRVEVLPTQKRHTLLTAQQNAVGSQSLSVPSDISIPELVNGVKIFNYDTNTEKTYTSADIQFSLKAKDTEYLELAKNPKKNEIKLKDMVEKAAKEAGYIGTYYHGSKSDFTIFKKELGGKSNSNASVGFWFTETEEGAKAWADNSWWGDNDQGKVYKTYLRLNNPKVYETVDTKAQRDELKKAYEPIDKEMSLYDSIYYFEDGRRYHAERYDYDKSKSRHSGFYAWDAFKAIVKKYDADTIDYYLSKVDESEREIVKQDAKRYLELGQERKALENQITELRYYDAYELFRTDMYKQIGLGAEDANIGGTGKYVENKDEMLKKYVDSLTQAGYDGIIIKNTSYDTSTFGDHNNQYVVFDSNQVKSAEPVTYDNDGNIIPLSERFNTKNDDIRYSLKDSEGKKLTKEQQEYFKNSKIRDENGNLLVMYHGTTRGGFTVFDGGKDYWYFTNDKKYSYTFEGRKQNGQFYPYTKERMEKGQATPQRYKVYLNVTNPYIADIDTVEDALYWDKTLASLLREKGFDALMVEDMSQVIVLNANQIKNTTNKNPSASDDIRNSLKGGISHKELSDTIADAQKGKKGAAERLAKYVDAGMIRTKTYDELIEKYGVIPTGERPHRDVQVPTKSGKNKKVSQTVRTILEAEATPDEAVPTIEKMVEDGIFSYDVYTDKQAIADSEAYIKEYGWDESLDDWFDAVNKGEVSKELTSMGWALYNNAANIAATTTSETERTSAIKTSLKILDAMVRHQRSAAQALQATRILKKLSPETQLYGVQKSVQALQNELADKYGKKAPDLKIDEGLAEQFINAKTPEERAEVEKEIFKDIGTQVPSRFIDKWNAWRYLAMLGNPRTHIRNIVGNAGFAPVVIAKDLTATAIESVVHRVSGKKTLRGKAIVWGSKADRSLLKAAWGDYKNVADLVSNGGKYNDFAMANQMIEEGRQIFKFKPLEWARKGNSKALEAEDVWFSKPHYAYALAQYCKANNITAEQIAKGVAIAPAREYAIKEARKATYKDTNAFSQFVSELGRKGDKSNPVKKVASTIIEGILPFRKTPANILVRGLEYSPLGLLKGLSYDLVQVSKGNKTATEAIDNISAGLTGTGLLALGVYLAAQGLVRGHGEDEEKEKKFNEMMGHQAYALELPNGESVTLDWLAPEALPFFVGVNIWETTKGTDEEVNFSSILKSVTNISEPMLEMSCLQGLNDLFEGIGYASSNDTSGLMSVLSSAVTSYLTQGLPTLGGQAERTSEENRMTTYTEKNSFLTGDMQYTLGKASAKIPFWDYNQIPYIDAWGRKEASGTALKRGLNNFLNPAYTSTINTSKAEEELLRLYEMIGDGGTFPERADKYFMVDGERKDLTADEYVRYATLKGEKSYKMVSDLIGSKEYKNLSDAEKVSAIKNAYDYANQKAKEAISNYDPDKWVATADELGENAEDFVLFKTKLSSTRNENDGKISRQEVGDIITNVAENDTDAWKMYLSEYDSKDDIAASESGIDFADYATFKGATANVEGDGKRGTIVDTILRMEIGDDDAWELYLTEYSNSSTEYAINRGIKGNDYMKFLDMLDKVDQPTKSGKYGSYTQAEVTAAINQLKGLTRQEKADLWQSVNTTWKKNPFR